MSSFSWVSQQWATFARVWYLTDGKTQHHGKIAGVALIKLQGSHKPVYHQRSGCTDHVMGTQGRRTAFSGSRDKKCAGRMLVTQVDLNR